jgi:hypothetical protein
MLKFENMNTHHTKFKGDIGLTKAIAELTELGHIVSIPISEHQHYDIIVEINNNLNRVQVKYSTNGYIKGATSYVNSNGKSTYRNYDVCDFDLYILYLPKIDRCLYVPNTNDFTSINIRVEHPKTNHSKYYWWEDFTNPEIKELPPRHQLKDFNLMPEIISPNRYAQRKVMIRPTKEMLTKELNETSFTAVGKKYGVSDNAVRKWAKKYAII